jgi:hypothetical protein
VRSLRIFLLVLCTSTLAVAGDNEFRGVVHAIEGHYGVRHTHIPLLGLAMFFVRPEGVSGMKLAVFENFQSPNASEDVSRVVENCLGPGWYPFVRVHSRNLVKADDEATLIYANPSDGKLRMMIVSVESSEATVIEFKLSERAIKQWLKDPGEKAEGEYGHHQHHGDN